MAGHRASKSIFVPALMSMQTRSWGTTPANQSLLAVSGACRVIEQRHSQEMLVSRPFTLQQQCPTSRLYGINT